MHLPVETGACLAADLGDIGEIGFRMPLACPLLDLVEQESERLVEELDRLEQHLGESGLEGLLRAQHPVLAEGVLDDELHGLLGADELRDELRAAPAGDEPEKDLGAREVPYR